MPRGRFHCTAACGIIKAAISFLKNSYFFSRLRLLYKLKTAWLLGFL